MLFSLEILKTMTYLSKFAQCQSAFGEFRGWGRCVRGSMDGRRELYYCNTDSFVGQRKLIYY